MSNSKISGIAVWLCRISCGVTLLTSIGGCHSAGAYRLASTSPSPPASELMSLSITVRGVTQVKWIRATRVEEVLAAVPGITVQVRGTDDLSLRLVGRGEALVMIDRAPALAGDLRLLYPWEIASVEVLRDVASTAVYGDRAANGVILVTTRRTRSGKLDGDPGAILPNRPRTHLDPDPHVLEDVTAAGMDFEIVLHRYSPSTLP